MTSRVFMRAGSLALIAALALALAVIPGVFRTGRVAAQTSTTPTTTTTTGTTTTTTTGTGTTTTGTTTTTPGTGTTGTTLPPAAAAITICGTVSAYTAATALAPGSITISGVALPLAANSAITGAGLLTNGAAVCLLADLNSNGGVTVAYVSSLIGQVSTLNICGTLTTFVTATASTNGSLVLGGIAIPVAAGTTVINPSVTTNGHYCAQGTLNASGQLISLTIGVVPLAATPYTPNGGFYRHGLGYAG